MHRRFCWIPYRPSFISRPSDDDLNMICSNHSKYVMLGHFTLWSAWKLMLILCTIIFCVVWIMSSCLFLIGFMLLTLILVRLITSLIIVVITRRLAPSSYSLVLSRYFIKPILLLAFHEPIWSSISRRIRRFACGLSRVRSSWTLRSLLWEGTSC